MSPRGVAIPNIREELFQATERLLARVGPSGLSSRAITQEAGVAKGILYNHFKDLDTFLAEFVADRFRRTEEGAARLPQLAGKGTVVGNLTDATISVFGEDATLIANLVMARPVLINQIEDSDSPGAFSFREVERHIAAYLDAEKKLGRVSKEADTKTIALVLVGAVHHLFMTGRAGSRVFRKNVYQIVVELVGGVLCG
jgi:AcrR family transcriptional regulator